MKYIGNLKSYLLQDSENVLIVAARTGQADIVRDFVNDFDLEDTDAVLVLEILIFEEHWKILFTIRMKKKSE